MIIHVESTTKVVDLQSPNGAIVPARVWEGSTDGGTKVHVYITRIALPIDADAQQFERELTECPATKPSPEILAIPTRLIL